MASLPVLLMHQSSIDHLTGAHPERPERIIAVQRELEAHGWLGYERVSSPAAPRSALTAVHTPSHVERMQRIAEAGGGSIDADTVLSPGSFQAALHAAGGAVELVQRVLSGAAPTGFSVHRPPGHHATANHAMGFCLFNNIAVAARWALDEQGLERVMIVDFDVHHGNGTNDIFGADPRVLFVSLHQSPLYPGSGPASDVGSGDGIGYTVNLPVAPGSGDAEFRSLIDGVAVPLALTFAPELILLSAGFDAHADDPLANCLVTDDGFSGITASLRDVGARLGVPVAAVLEGGYDLGALARSVRATMETLAAPPGELVEPGPGSGSGSSSASASASARAARARLARYWPALGRDQSP